MSMRQRKRGVETKNRERYTNRQTHKQTNRLTHRQTERVREGIKMAESHKDMERVNGERKSERKGKPNDLEPCSARGESSSRINKTEQKEIRNSHPIKAK